jgi:hypothetical protein
LLGVARRSLGVARRSTGGLGARPYLVGGLVCERKVDGSSVRVGAECADVSRRRGMRWRFADAAVGGDGA